MNPNELSASTNLKINIATGVLLAAMAFGLYQCVDIDPKAGQPTETLNDGFVGCISEDFLTQYNASSHRFQVGMMTKNLCIPTSNLVHFPFVVLSNTSFGVRQVRLMLPDDQYADLFVPIEATMRSFADVSE